MIPDRLPFHRRLRRLFWPVSIDREISDEIDAHIELQTRRYVEAGMSPAEARAVAWRRFGDVEHVRDECRDIRSDMEVHVQRAELLAELRMDAGYAFRAMLRNPLFAFVAILTIALGIGANTAIFSVLDTVLLRPLPYAHADRLVMIWNNNAQSALSITAVAAPEYFDLKEKLRAHDAVGAITRQPSTLVAAGGEPERLTAYVVTPNMFDLLGASPMIGRTFGGDDGKPSAPRVIVLSNALWLRRFGGDPAIIGKTVNLAGFVRTIVGVMPPDVRFPDAPLSFLREKSDLWIPSTWESSRGDSRGNQVLAVIARRRPGVSDAQARADVDGVSAAFRAAFPDRYASAASKGWSLVAIPVRDQMVGSVRRGLLVISAAVAFVLLIACVNVANLLLARGAARQRELAVRLALGAGRGRLIRQLLTESTMLATVGGAFGLALAWVGVRALAALDGGQIPRLAESRIDGTVLLFTFGATMLAGLLVGIAPALQQSAGNVQGTLGEAARGSSMGRGAGRLRRVLVVAQVAMALLVLVGAGLLGRSFLALESVKPGFVAANVVTFQVTVPRTKYDDVSKLQAFYDQLGAAAQAIPGVVQASAVYPLPMGGDGWSGSFRIDGNPSGPNDAIPHAEYSVATPGYFRTVGIPLIAGRDFDATDRANGIPVAVVDEALAKKYWPNESAIGKRIGYPPGWWTVVGVVGHVRRSRLDDEGEPQIYLAYAQNTQATMSVVLRTSSSAAAFAAPVRAVVGALDKEIPIAKYRAMTDIVGQALARQRFDALLLLIFAITALTLATVGLYGVMAFLVSQRTREIGIRIALGGQPGTIRGMVLREGILIVVAGLVVGAVASLGLAGAIRGLLYGISPSDPLTYGGIAGLLLIVGAAASYVPARRATRVDPMIAVRE